MNDDTTTRTQRLIIENPPMNAKIEPLEAVCDTVPEIKPVKRLSFVPTNHSIKTADYNSDYSDVIATYDNHGNADALLRIDTRPCPHEDCPDHDHLIKKVKREFCGIWYRDSYVLGGRYDTISIARP